MPDDNTAHPVVGALADTPAGIGLPANVDPELLRAYKTMLGYQFGGAFCLMIVLGVSLFAVFKIQAVQPPFLFLVMLTGVLGAFFSALTRLYKIEQMALAVISPTVTQLGGFYLVVYSFIPPMVGAIAAVVIYVAFAGDLLQGGLFPAISCKPADTCVSFGDVVNNYTPTAPKDYAKALIWGFIAGFSERLVPDTLQSFAAQRTEAQA